MTPYQDIYGWFLQKITDYKMMTLEEEDATALWTGWLRSAVAKQKIIDHELTFDDENQSFVEDLSDIEKEILAVGMCVEWLTPQVLSVTNTLQMFGGKEEKFYSQANHLSEIRAVLKNLKIEARKLARTYQYDQFARNGA